VHYHLQYTDAVGFMWGAVTMSIKQETQPTPLGFLTPWADNSKGMWL